MRLVRFRHDQHEAFGVIEGDRVAVLAGSPWETTARTGASHPLDAVTLLAPVQPPEVIAIGLNYRRHAEESGFPLPPAPVIFLKATSSVTGPGADILLPEMAPDQVDFEAELAIVIGRTCRRVSEADALDHVLGYTCANDVSARDCQLKLDTQWARGKSFDTFCPLGPWIETSLDGDRADISLRVNGQTLQASNTSDLIFSCRQLVSYCSRCMTLRPGTVILTGTPSGVGFARKPPVFLRAGDVVEVTVGGIGTLRNQVAREPGA
jgi:2-keto-4-pentenoate hydratase/2-oxohepta-3-ene-1,7-dioic acid hydratase in catechol pathway